MARYGQKFKERVVARLLPPESSPVEAVSLNPERDNVIQTTATAREDGEHRTFSEERPMAHSMLVDGPSHQYTADYQTGEG